MINIYNLKFRMIAIVIFLMLIALAFDFLYLVPTVRRHEFREAEEFQAAIAAQIASAIDSEFSQAIAEIEAIATHPSIVSMDKKKLDRTVADYNLSSQFFNYYFVMDKTGKWVSYPTREHLVGKGIPMKNTGWVRRTFREDRTVFLDVVKTLVGTLVSGFSTPIRSETGEHLGLLRGVIVTSRENTLLSSLMDTQVGDGGHAYIVSANGWLIAHPGVKQSPEEFKVYDYKDYLPVKRVLKGETGVVEYEYEGETWIAAFHPIRSTKWGIVVQKSKADILSFVREETSIYIFTAVAVSLLAILLIPLVLSYALRPLSGLVGSIRNRSFSADEVFSKDEIGQLAREFSTLYSELKSSEASLKSLNEELEERVSERTLHLESAREELQISEERYRSLFQHSNEGIILHDLDGRIIDANYRALEMFGFTDGEMRASYVESLLHEQERGRIDSGLQRIIGEKSLSYEIELLRKDGSSIPAEVSSSLINLDDKSIILSHVHDVTERMRIEEQLRHSQKMEAVGTLTAGVAHEFNNIMTSVLGFAELLQEDLARDSSLRGYADKIVHSAGRAAKLTDGMLAYTRKKITRLVSLDVNEVLLDVNEFLASLVGENIDLRVETSSDPLPVLADSSQLEQILLNLTTNGIDAMPDGGTLTISARKAIVDSQSVFHRMKVDPGTYALIAVSDTGTGMDEEVMENIFEPFFTTKDVGRGTGLGLSMVYGMVKRHEGHIDFLSEPDKGTCFHVYLPLSRTEIHLEPTNPAVPELPLKGTETVLLAEDDESVRSMITRALENNGYTVVAALNGESAVALYSENRGRIDLLLFDVAMPGMDGVSAINKISELAGEIPKVLFISGHIHESSRRTELLDMGYELLAKPFSPVELLRKVRQKLDPG